MRRRGYITEAHLWDKQTHFLAGSKDGDKSAHGLLSLTSVTQGSYPWKEAEDIAASIDERVSFFSPLLLFFFPLIFTCNGQISMYPREDK